MDNFAKSIILVIILIGLGITYLFFYGFKVRDVPVIYEENVFLDFLGKKVANYPGVSVGIEKESKYFHKVSYEIARLQEEHYVDSADASRNAHDLYRKYAPSFLDYCKNRFQEDDWALGSMSDGRYRWVFMEDELGFLAEDGNKNGIRMRNYKNWGDVYHIIGEYRKARDLTWKDDFVSVDVTKIRLRDAKNYMEVPELRRCSNLKRALLEYFPSNLRYEHKRYIKKSIQSLSYDLTVSNYGDNISRIRGLNDMVSSFKSLWNDSDAWYYDSDSWYESEDLKKALWEKPKEILNGQIEKLYYPKSYYGYWGYDYYAQTYDKVAEWRSELSGSSTGFKQMPTKLGYWDW